MEKLYIIYDTTEEIFSLKFKDWLEEERLNTTMCIVQS